MLLHYQRYLFDIFDFFTRHFVSEVTLSVVRLLCQMHYLITVHVLQLTCFILPNQYGYFLKPKTIWNAEGTTEIHSLLEQILHLEPLEVSLNAYGVYGITA
jgi:hypothetical protein